MTDEDEAPERSSETVAPVALRHNRNFRYLWIGQVLSDLGSQFGALAYPLLVLELTGSPVLAGAVATVTSLAAFAVRLPAGSLADRIDRRQAMIVCDGVRTVVLAILAVGVALHVATWPEILVAATIDRLGDTIFTPCSTAALPAIVASSQLEDAWAATEARQFAAGLGGPVLGGLLFSIGSALPFVGDTISYGVSTFTSSRLKGEFRPKRDPESHTGLWSEAFEGMKLVWHDALLKAVIVQAPLINFFFTGIVITVTIGLRYHGTSALTIGIVQSAIMAGGLLGAIVAPRFQGKLSLSQLVLLLTGGGSICLLVAAFIYPSPYVAIPIAVPFFVSPVSNAALFAALLRRTPEEMRGRVNNALLQVATGLAVAAPFAAGLIVAHLPTFWNLGVFAAGLGVCAVLSLSLRGLRDAEGTLQPSPS